MSFKKSKKKAVFYVTNDKLGLEYILSDSEHVPQVYRRIYESWGASTIYTKAKFKKDIKLGRFIKISEWEE